MKKTLKIVGLVLFLGSMTGMSDQSVSANTTSIHENLKLQQAEEVDLHNKKVKQAENEANWNQRQNQQSKAEAKAKQRKVDLERARKARIAEENKRKAIQSSIQKEKLSQISTSSSSQGSSSNQGVSKVSSSQSSISQVSQSTQPSVVIHQNQSSSNRYAQQEKQTSPSTSPQVTSGFNFLNHHYPIAYFSGNGAVPANNYVYRWSAIPNYYLVERMGAAGAYINGLTVGSAVTIDGHTYHVAQVLTGFKNTVEAAGKIAEILNGRIGIQTCETSSYGGYSTLTIWIAQ